MSARNLSARVNFQLSLSEREYIEQIAAADDLSLSQAVRRIIRHAMREDGIEPSPAKQPPISRRSKRTQPVSAAPASSPRTRPRSTGVKVRAR